MELFILYKKNGRNKKIYKKILLSVTGLLFLSIIFTNNIFSEETYFNPDKVLSEKDTNNLKYASISNKVDTKPTIGNINVMKGCNSGNCVNGKGKYIFSNGNVYEGGWLNGKRHGKGIYIHHRGEIFVGVWDHGRRHGRIKHIGFDGTEEERLYQHGKRIRPGCNSENCTNGTGEFIYSNGNSYIGSWINGQKHGKGTYFYFQGDRYEGNWLKDKKHGKGVYYRADGDVDFCLYNEDTLLATNKNEKRIRKQEELVYWMQVESIKTIKSYNDYLQKYPKGKFASKAKTEIKTINKERDHIEALTQKGHQLLLNKNTGEETSYDLASEKAPPASPSSTSQPVSQGEQDTLATPKNKKYYEYKSPKTTIKKQSLKIPLSMVPLPEKEESALLLKMPAVSKRDALRLPYMADEGFSYKAVPSHERCVYKATTGRKGRSYFKAHTDYLTFSNHGKKYHRTLFTMDTPDNKVVEDIIMKDDGKQFYPVFYLRSTKNEQGDLTRIEEVAFNLNNEKNKARVVRKTLVPEPKKKNGSKKDIDITLTIPQDTYAPLMFDYGYRVANLKVGDKTKLHIIDRQGILAKLKIKVESIEEVETSLKTFFCYKIVQAPTKLYLKHLNKAFNFTPFIQNRVMPEVVFYYSVEEPHRLIRYCGYNDFSPTSLNRRKTGPMNADYMDVRLCDVMPLTTENLPNHNFIFERMAKYELMDVNPKQKRFTIPSESRDSAKLKSPVEKIQNKFKAPPDMTLLSEI